MAPRGCEAHLSGPETRRETGNTLGPETNLTAAIEPMRFVTWPCKAGTIALGCVWCGTRRLACQLNTQRRVGYS